MEKTESQNPLKQYFRQIKFYIKLPSGQSFYPEDTLTLTDEGEIGIMPMTGADELILKNPDALLNGEALIEVIKSCVPSVKQPRALITNDIDAIITAIRYATYSDKLETDIDCPSCGHENRFKLDLQYSLDNMEFLDDEYVANLDSGVSVFVKPYSFPSLLKGLHAQLEHTKLSRVIEDESYTDEQRLAMFSTLFKDLSAITYDLTCQSIIKVVDERNDINVTEPKYIKEFIKNIDKLSADRINDLIKEINQIGIKRTFKAKCSECDHEWDCDIDFNPVNFF